MFGPEAVKFVQRCLLFYSLALMALGFLLGVAFTPLSSKPQHHDSPAQYDLDHLSLATSRRG